VGNASSPDGSSPSTADPRSSGDEDARLTISNDSEASLFRNDRSEGFDAPTVERMATVVEIPSVGTMPTAAAEGKNGTEEFLRALASEVVDKQYRLYTWNDAKVQALVTTNAALFAAVGFLYRECLRDALALYCLGTATAFLGASLIMCLVHVVPRITSGKTGNDPNTRTLRGIGLYKQWEDYRDAFRTSTKDGVLTDTIRQIYGMAANNLRSARIVTIGVRLTIGGVIMVLAALSTSAFAARGYHLLGTWQIDAQATNSVISSSAAIPDPSSVPVTSGAPATIPLTSPAPKPDAKAPAAAQATPTKR